MKKIIGIITIVIIGFIGFKGFQYYNETYKPSLAYAIVPEKIPEKIKTVDTEGVNITENGGQQSYTYVYTFEFEKRSGEKQTLEYILSGIDVKPFKPGSRVTATISKTRVLKGPFIAKD